MKFGASLPRNQVPEWGSEYINYKGLKKLIKSAAEEEKQGHEPDLAAFFHALDRNLEKVDAFYQKRYTAASRRLKTLADRYGMNDSHPRNLENSEQEDLVAALLELRSQLRKLQWFGDVNRRGFVKITKKLDKQISVACTQHQYLASRVDPRPFSSNPALTEDMTSINTWLSQFGEIKARSDADSVHSLGSLARIDSKKSFKPPEDLLSSVDSAIDSSDDQNLAKHLDESAQHATGQSQAFQKFLFHCLHRAISIRSKPSISVLLRRLGTLEEQDDINQRNCLHRFVIGIGRARRAKTSGGSSPELAANRDIVPAEAPMLQTTAYANKESESSLPAGHSDGTADLVEFILSELTEAQRPALSAQDTYGRTPLHYAAKFGFVEVCRSLLNHMIEWGQLNPKDGVDSMEWQDLDGNSPLALSVIEGWTLTTETLLDACRPPTKGNAVPNRIPSWSKSNGLLAIATKVDFPNIVRMLAEAGADANYQDEIGETALHVAAHFGHTECAKSLFEGSKWQEVNIDTVEKSYNWTALHLASVEGHLSFVKLMINMGADITKTDVSGWTAKEHAALRGHMDVLHFLGANTPQSIFPESDGTLGVSDSALHRRSSRTDHTSPHRSVEKDMKDPIGIKSFGHRYLVDEAMVLVSLGSMDARKNVKPVTLDNIPFEEAHATQLDTALSIVISAAGANGESGVFDLPVQGNVSTEPISFLTKDPAKVKLLFDIVPTYSGSQESVIGRAVAVLSSVKPSVGFQRTSLQGDVSIPIMAAKTLDIIGTVNFNFLVVTSISHPNMSVSESHTYWKQMTAASQMVIGHRGLGKNQADRRSLQLGENTMQSFIAAANLGASYVEFDVQLTKDHVPVIYHDFLVSETGVDAPVHTLTLEQFLAVNDPHASQNGASNDSAEDLPLAVDEVRDPRSSPNLRAQRANSVGSTLRYHNNDRMKHTRDFKIKGFKGNSRGNFIQAPFTTLEEMLRKLPESIGFNIEMKYPMLLESEEQEMDTYAIELNNFVDTVLKMVYDLSGKRNIIFSSFHPDMCLLLSLKQPSIPVLFLTDAGSCEVSDVRASSLQEAIRFASRWNLLGIVSAAEPLVACPRLVRVVKESGLVCVSYGTLNNDPKNVKMQFNQGIDAVIVDSVLAVRQGLTKDPEAVKVEKSGEIRSAAAESAAATSAAKVQEVAVAQ